jgi:vancomycin resistance protein YoaR
MLSDSPFRPTTPEVKMTTEHSSNSRSTSRASRHSQRKASRLPGWLQAWPVPARVAFLTSAALLLVIGFAAGADAAVSAGRIHPGVQVGALDVGGRTESEARAAIAAFVAEQSATPVTAQAGGESWEVTASTISLSVDATTLAGEAFAIGRGAFGPMLADRLRAVFGGVTVPLSLSCDETALAALVLSMNETVATPPIDAGVSVEGVAVTRIEPADGIGVGEKEARELLLPAFVSSDRVVEFELGPIPPAVDSDGVQQAYEDALKMVSAPLTLFYADKQWEVPAETIGGWIGFRRLEGVEPVTLEAYVVSEDVSATVLPMVAEVGKPARDAGFSVSSGTVSIVPAEDGLQADAADLALKLDSVLTGTGERRAELTMHRGEPEITTAVAQSMGIVERISTFTTDYAASNKPRVNNIHILADALDGTLIPPGGTFSFNGTIGERTAAKGYQEANAIVNGKLVPQLGGGICQVGTTIFNTVFFSGLPVVERHNHSQCISHYPTGRDATVSWGGPDFRFKNDTPNWILIATGYSSSTVTISLYGTDPGYQVTYDTGAWTDIKDPPIKEVPDPTLPAGSRIVDEKGVSGRTIVVVRHVISNGAEIRTDSFKSVYRATEEVVRVGTGAASPSGPTTTTP